MSNLICDLGPNPVNKENAYKQATESGLDAEHCVIELSSNAQDYGTIVDIKINGTYVSGINKNQHKVRATSIIVQDNGCGMHHDTVLERFRGAFQDSESHFSETQCGRNGVGVKTAFQDWKNIFVETTTKDFIPAQWTCSPENFNVIDMSYKSLSSLKLGDPDTELRKYNIMQNKAVCDDAWVTVPHVQSGTKITLRNPRDTVILDVNEVIRRLSHSIEFLSHKDNKITLWYPNNESNMTNIVIKPFFRRAKLPDFLCHAKGSSKEDVCINVTGKQSLMFLKDDSLDLEPIDFDIKVTASSTDRNDEPNEFILSICGANVYDTYKKGNSPSGASIYILNLDKFDSVQGFGYRIHGYIKCNDIRLKQALRHNKSAIDSQDKYSQLFLGYVVKLFKELNGVYVKWLEQFNVEQEDSVLKEAKNDFDKFLKGTGGPSKTLSNVHTSHQNLHAEYVCNNCSKTWKVPKLKMPSFCAEYNIDETDEGCGCGSKDIVRKTLKSASIEFKWVPFFGNFIPAKYEADRNMMSFAKYHPAFITHLSGKNKTMFMKTAIVNNAIIALAIQHSNSVDFEKEHALNLKGFFQNQSNAAHINECIRLWKENNINQKDI